MIFTFLSFDALRVHPLCMLRCTPECIYRIRSINGYSSANAVNMVLQIMRTTCRIFDFQLNCFSPHTVRNRSGSAVNGVANNSLQLSTVFVYWSSPTKLVLALVSNLGKCEIYNVSVESFSWQQFNCMPGTCTRSLSSRCTADNKTPIKSHCR